MIEKKTKQNQLQRFLFVWCSKCSHIQHISFLYRNSRTIKILFSFIFWKYEEICSSELLDHFSSFVAKWKICMDFLVSKKNHMLHYIPSYHAHHIDGLILMFIYLCSSFHFFFVLLFGCSRICNNAQNSNTW